MRSPRFRLSMLLILVAVFEFGFALVVMAERAKFCREKAIRYGLNEVALREDARRSLSLSEDGPASRMKKTGLTIRTEEGTIRTCRSLSLAANTVRPADFVRVGVAEP